MNKFKLRAECLSDVVNFINMGILDNYKIESNNAIDCTLEFETDGTISINELKEVLKVIQDCHVMVQTIKPLNEYTGERI